LENLKHLSSLYADYLNKNRFSGHPETLYTPMNYIMELGGKRVRPLLALLGAEACGGRPEDALLWAHSVEVFHNFTLVHDDIMDNAPTRRGMPTVHEKWGIAEGILSGDNMLIAVYEGLLYSEYLQKMELLQLLSKTAREVCEGQQLDMDSAVKSQVTEADYLEMIRLKTAVLLGCSLQGGGMCAGASAEVQQLLYDFAIQLGLSFQLQDDWLDAFGNPEQTGKMAGGDIAEGKKTWLYIQGNADGKVDAIWNRYEGELRVAPTLTVLLEMKLDKQLKTKSEAYYHEALKTLDTLQEHHVDTTLLRALATWLLERAY
jgi:geranylgeranyl diphosphate synthase type II